MTLAHLSPDVLILEQLIPESGDLAGSAKRARFVDLAEVSAMTRRVHDPRMLPRGEGGRKNSSDRTQRNGTR